MNANHVNNPQFEITTLKKTPIDSGKKSAGYIQSEKAKLEKAVDADTFKPQKYEQSFIQKVIAYRTSKGWNQQTFANQLQLQANIIKGIENNSLPYQSSYVSKINNYMAKNK